MRLEHVVGVLEDFWPSALAAEWDAVGLAVGDPVADVQRVRFAIDPVAVVVQEALDGGCQLLVAHHPLYLHGTSSVAADGPKGRVVEALVRGGCGLFVAHTNADHARPGVNDALADLFGLQGTVPLDPVLETLDTLVVSVPTADAGRLRAALTAAGAGQIGSYDSCTWSVAGTGAFRPLPGAAPAVGEVGRLEQVDEVRIETVVPADRRDEVLRVLLATHPYETPAWSLLPSVPLPGPAGLGRVGDLPQPMALGELVELTTTVLPPTFWGVRAAGDARRVVRRLAVCGGAGDDVLGQAAAAGADALLTSDLRHHRALEAPEGLALIDAAHWATEWPWLPAAAARLASVTGVGTSVSTTCTDPWITSHPPPRSPTA